MFTTPVLAVELEQVAAALRSRGFEAHIAPDAATARLVVRRPDRIGQLRSTGSRRRMG